jgi:hypothetical protein
MILGVFSRDVPESKAREALDRLRALVVDYNELRVVPPIEMAAMVSGLPDARLKCEDLSRALNKVFAREHEVNLERLRGLSKREVSEYLDGVDGLDAYSRARVRLLGLQQHAIPLDEAMWAYARKEEIVDPRCSLEEAQAFLERRIPEGEALEFVGLLEKQAWTEMGAAVRSGEVERISSVPPDRTARNMLQLVAAGREAAAAAPDTPEAEDETTGALPRLASTASRRAKVTKGSGGRERAAKTSTKRREGARTGRKTDGETAAGQALKTQSKGRAQSQRKSVASRKPKAGKAETTKAAGRARRVAAKAKSA